MKSNPRITQTVQRSGESFPADKLPSLLRKKKRENDKEIEASRKRIVQNLFSESLREIGQSRGLVFGGSADCEVKFLQWSFDLGLRFYHCETDLHECLVELQGGMYTKGPDGQRGGAHNRADRYTNNREKINAAQIAGHTVLEFTTLHFVEPYTYIRDTLRDMIESKL